MHLPLLRLVPSWRTKSLTWMNRHRVDPPSFRATDLSKHYLSLNAQLTDRTPRFPTAAQLVPVRLDIQLGAIRRHEAPFMPWAIPPS